MADSQQLALSAAVFTAGVDGWIPASWGNKPSEAQDAAVFEKRLRNAAITGDDSKLGVGHPDIGVPKSRANHLSALEKRLGRVDRSASAKTNGKVDDGPSARPKEVNNKDEDDDEGESRARSVASKKKKASAFPDLLGGKKKNKGKQVEKVHPLLNLAPKQEAKGVGAGGDDDNDNDINTSVKDKVDIEVKPTSPTSPKKQIHTDPPLSPTSKKRPRDDRDGPPTPIPTPASSRNTTHHQSPSTSPKVDSAGESKLSKTQRRRDARKRARLARNPLG